MQKEKAAPKKKEVEAAAAEVAEGQAPGEASSGRTVFNRKTQKWEIIPMTAAEERTLAGAEGKRKRVKKSFE